LPRRDFYFGRRNTPIAAPRFFEEAGAIPQSSCCNFPQGRCNALIAVPQSLKRPAQFPIAMLRFVSFGQRKLQIAAPQFLNSLSAKSVLAGETLVATYSIFT
jgi:hypothetical protein